jgi:hypothetical protein
MDSKEFNKLTRAEKLRVPVKDLPKQSKTPMFVFLGIVALTMTLCVGGRTCSNSESTSNDSKKVKGIDSTSLWYYSKVVAKEYVKQQLKSPSTADFPDSDFKVWLEPDSLVVVKCAVDAQNSYGAMIRGSYYLKMKWRKDFTDTDNWTLLKIENEE